MLFTLSFLTRAAFTGCALWFCLELATSANGKDEGSQAGAKVKKNFTFSLLALSF